MPTIRLTPELLAERAARVRAVQSRADASALVRPAREPAKREALAAIEGLGPFQEAAAPRPTMRPARRG